MTFTVSADPGLTAAGPPPDDSGWTCPFCSLLCDDLRPDVGGLGERGGPCVKARHRLAALGGGPAEPTVDGRPTDLDEAIANAAARLSLWRQPLFAGLGTDIAGARALFPLAARCDAICDHADGEPLMQGVRALQDRGQFTTTLGELRSRCDLLVMVGSNGIDRYPEFFRRAGLGETASPCAAVVFLGTEAPSGLSGVTSVQAMPARVDLAGDLQQLSALVDERRVPGADPALAELARQLRAARYAVFVYEASALRAPAALSIEMLNRVVGTLNRRTRAAVMSLGGSDGAYSVNQTLTWLSGLPLRTRVSRQGLQHEPHAMATERLIGQGAVDGLLWIASFDAERLPPPTALPRIVLGPPGMGPRLAAASGAPPTVFIPVATPGWNAAGHLFRTDGSIVLPLVAVRDDGLPGVATVLQRLLSAMPPLSAPPTAAALSEVAP